ncbi:hypothetical protein OSG_eHP34_00020 [environmental Halophage eHP-34]|nr:hypothetical protein OSG_eHP34_00020 [environmental Halophage eHP-34]
MSQKITDTTEARHAFAEWFAAFMRANNTEFREVRQGADMSQHRINALIAGEDMPTPEEMKNLSEVINVE